MPGAPAPAPSPPPLLAFGPFLLDRAQQQLLRDGRPVALGPRPYAVLEQLVLQAGQTVGKHALLDAVWGHRHLSESVLKGCINTLRMSLGDTSKAPAWIETVPRRGYRFVGVLHEVEVAKAVPPSPSPAPPTPPGNLPAAPGPLVGREADIAELRALLAEHRLLTLVGAAGIGKTRLALALAADARGRDPAPLSWADGVWLVRLDALSDAANDTEALLPTIAAALRLSAGAATSPAALARALSAQSLLLVLDNCEHLLAVVAPLVSELLAHAPGLRLLATSQEPLRVQGEQVWRVAPLAWPEVLQAAEMPPAAVVEGFGAVALFVHCVNSRLPGFELNEDNRDAIVALCARLDGLPLALELAAARVPLLGVQGVLDRLHARLELLSEGRRDAAPRHRTLRAALEWSHGLLSPREQSLLHRVSVFAGSFSIVAAQSVAADAGLSPVQVIDGLGVLLDKSLLVSVPGEPPRLRLFDSIRSFALEQLGGAGATIATQTRHMQWMRDALARAAPQWHDTPWLTWLAQLRPELDNLRVALRHALQHDPDGAIALFTLGLSLWQRAGLRHEAVRWFEAVRPLLAGTHSPSLKAAFAQAIGKLYVYGLHGLPAPAEAALQEATRLHHELGDTLNEYFDLYLLNNTQLSITPDADPRPIWHRMKALEGPDWGPLRTRYARQIEGMRLRDSGDTQGYRQFCVDEIARMHDAGDTQGQWTWRYGLALAEHDDGHAERAIALLQQTLDEVRAAGLLRSHTHVAAMLASMRLEQGQVPACLPLAREVLNLLRADGALWWMAGALGYAAFWLGRPEDAARLLGWAEALVARRGEKPGLFFARLRAGCEARLRLTVPAEQFEALLEEGTRLDDAHALRLAFD